MYPDTDYIVVGSNGFAQVGRPDYPEKAKVEMAYLKGYLEHNYPVPEEFKGHVWFQIKKFPHDFGSYHELCIVYYKYLMEEWETENDVFAEEDPDRTKTKYNRLWKWINNCEMVELETEEIDAEIASLYALQLRSKQEHLQAIHVDIAKDEEPPEMKLHG